MKIAIITDDGKTISPHFGRALYYLVVNFNNGKETHREIRPKIGHAQFANEPHLEIPGQPHGTDPASQDRHALMAATISDCQVLLARGMGQGVFDTLNKRHITPVLTEVSDIEEALTAYLNGKLEHVPARLH
jgi:predicted Fe-Mo cluster-binding NifX family protein